MRVRTLVTDCDIRNAAVVDAADLVYLTQRAYAEPHRSGAPVLFVDEDEESLARDMDRGWHMLVARHGGLAVGAVRWRVDGTAAKVARLAVDPRHRRRGIAAALLQTVEEQASTGGAQSLGGEVPLDAALVAWFARHGFQVASERSVGPLRFVQLQKRLSPPA